MRQTHLASARVPALPVQTTMQYSDGGLLPAPYVVQVIHPVYGLALRAHITEWCYPTKIEGRLKLDKDTILFDSFMQALNAKDKLGRFASLMGKTHDHYLTAEVKSIHELDIILDA